MTKCYAPLWVEGGRWAAEPLQKACDVGHSLRMPIAQFENRNDTPLVLIVHPSGDKYEVPPFATAGVRYSLQHGAEDRCYTVVSDRTVEFWCNSDTYELDIVHPSAFDALLCDICENGGWCGGVNDGNPTTVDDLLPRAGEISARLFAELVLRADGWPEGEPLDDKHLSWLQAKFVEHLRAESVDAEALVRNVARPFGNARC